MNVAGRNAVRAAGLSQPEGPVARDDGSVVLVEMGEDRECVTIVEAAGSRRELAHPGGRPTGLALDGEGFFWVAGGEGNSLVRLSPEGDVVLTIRGDEQGEFLFPNDLAFGPDGHLYMTDSGMRPNEFISGHAIRPDFMSARYFGTVFEIDPVRGRVMRRVAEGLRFANGIAFAADGTLFYNESLSGLVYRHPLGGRQEVFANVLKPGDATRFIGPDGMAFAEDGRLFCAVYGQGEVVVMSPAGSILPPVITNGDRPTNVAFASAGTTLFVTEVEHGALEIVDVGATGLALNRPKPRA